MQEPSTEHLDLPLTRAAAERGRQAAERERRYLKAPLVQELVRKLAQQAYRAEQWPDGREELEAAAAGQEAEEAFVSAYLEAYYMAWQERPWHRRWFR